MTVVQRAAQTAASVFDRLRTIGPPPAPTPEPRLPLKNRDRSREFAAGVPPVPGPGRRAPGVERPLGATHPGQRERRGKTKRRRRDRRTADKGSPYGTERRTGADDRQADRRGAAADLKAGIGLTRDYFAAAESRPAGAAMALPADLITRFNG